MCHKVHICPDLTRQLAAKLEVSGMTLNDKNILCQCCTLSKNIWGNRGFKTLIKQFLHIHIYIVYIHLP